MRQPKAFPRACVASPHYLASAAGLAVLATGGNALDAAIATNLTLGVVMPYLCGYGGDLFALIWAEERVHAYNGSGRAPAAATREAVEARAGSPSMPQRGPISVTVPGAPEGWFTLLERFGTRSFGDLADPALRYAADGFPLTRRGVESLDRSASLFPPTAPWNAEWRRVYGGAASEGTLRQPDLARTIETLAADGPGAYYGGPIGTAVADHLSSLGGLMAEQDLGDHTGEWVEPLHAEYRGLDVLELPPNTQGVTALEALLLAEASGLPPDGPERLHLLMEAMKLALSDRDGHVTDPTAMRVPASAMLTPDWIDARVELLDRDRAGSPAPGRAAAGGTIYLCAADADGMCVSLIQSNYMGFGSGVTVPGWGINLQNRGAFFSLDSGHANVIAPRKRTLHTLIPAMALARGRPLLLFGSMGGDGQAQTHLQLLTRVVADGLDIQAAIDAPRWFVSPADWSVMMESRFEPALVDDLRRRGHVVATTGPFDSLLGHAHAIRVTSSGYEGATDPRAEGAVLGL